MGKKCSGFEGEWRSLRRERYDLNGNLSGQIYELDPYMAQLSDLAKTWDQTFAESRTRKAGHSQDRYSYGLRRRIAIGTAAAPKAARTIIFLWLSTRLQKRRITNGISRYRFLRLRRGQ